MTSTRQQLRTELAALEALGRKADACLAGLKFGLCWLGLLALLSLSRCDPLHASAPLPEPGDPLEFWMAPEGSALLVYRGEMLLTGAELQRVETMLRNPIITYELAKH